MTTTKKLRGARFSCWVAALAIAAATTGCEKKPTAHARTPVAEPAVPDPAAADLKQFLDGMLVTSTARVPEFDDLWPVVATEGASTVDRLVQAVGRESDFRTREALVAELGRASPPDRARARLLNLLFDFVGAEQVWREVLARDPNNLEASAQLLWSEAAVDWRKALRRVAKISTAGAKGGKFQEEAAQIEGARCLLLFRTKQLDSAHAVCLRAMDLSRDYGMRTLAKVLLAQGKVEEAESLAAKVAALRPDSSLAVLTSGLAQQSAGRPDVARATWNLGLLRWPGDVLLTKAVRGPPKSVFEWENEEWEQQKQSRASRLAFCGHYYLDLGMPERAEACFAASEHLVKGPALAHRLVFEGQAQPVVALPKAIEAINAGVTHVDLLTATAWLYLRSEQPTEAKRWIERALADSPNEVRAISLMWQACAKQKDYLCVIDYRKRLGIPTHLNVDQYRDAEKALREQQQKNAIGLAPSEPTSDSSPRPPEVSEIVLIPLGDRVPAETEGIEALLSSDFKGFPVGFGPRAVLPAVYSAETNQVAKDELVRNLPTVPGRIYLIEEDLGGYDSSFTYAAFDPAHARGIVSLSRLRSLSGSATEPGIVLEGSTLAAVKSRLRSELRNVVGKALGMSYPCDKTFCAMHDRRTIGDLPLRSPAFCEKHTRELDEILRRLTRR